MFNSSSAISGGASVERVAQLIEESGWNSDALGQHGWVASDFVVLGGASAYELYNAGPDVNELLFTADDVEIAQFGIIHVQLVDGLGQPITGYHGRLRDEENFMSTSVSAADSLVVYDGLYSGYGTLKGSVHVRRSVMGFHVATSFFDGRTQFSGSFAVSASDCSGIRFVSQGFEEEDNTFASGFANLSWRK